MTGIALPRDPDIQVDVFLWATDIREIVVVTTHIIHNGLKSFRYWPGIGVAFNFVGALRNALGESAQAQLFLSVMTNNEGDVWQTSHFLRYRHALRILRGEKRLLDFEDFQHSPMPYP